MMAKENYPENPLILFNRWLEEAAKKELTDPNAFSLSTVDRQGRPSSRIVLLKSVDDDGFVFYTNLESRKAQEICKK